MEIQTTDDFLEWLDRLKDKRAQLRIDLRIRRLAGGNPGDHRNLSGGISELRITEGQGYRVYYTMRGETLVVLLHGGDKSSKKAQQKDIDKAKELAKALELEKLYDYEDNTLRSKPSS